VFDINKTDEALHRTDIESLEKRIMELALSRTEAHHGAIFLYDPDEKALAIDFHVVEGLIVTLPGALLRRRMDGRSNGIAFWVLDHNAPYVCRDADSDPNYAHYFLDVASITAVPIPYQGRAIGVISVSSRRKNAFDDDAVAALVELAASSAKFLRRAQLYRRQRDEGGRPFLIKGLSAEWLEVERRMEQVAPTDAPVLVHGESGTGKDLVARATHFNSRRREMPFVTVNCAAIPETLLESVLFGHVKGAFTGATFNKIGEFQKAHGGTLFLDEIGDLPMTLQAKVLRAVEQGEVLPLGSNKLPSRVDVRLICATNKDLAQMVRDRAFRDDLYYRLSVMTMVLPPLRTYQHHNIEVLANVFLDHATRQHQLDKKRFTAAAMGRLRDYSFPGNVRELKNAVEHAAIMALGSDIMAEDLPTSIAPPTSAKETGESAAPTSTKHKTLKELREEWVGPPEQRYLTEVMNACDGNVRLAAERAGVNTVTMYRLLKKHGLKLEKRLVADSSDEPSA
jgi:transcriptional regulator with GAF, ATPase, and Fis domain